jgi:hypothetical protein
MIKYDYDGELHNCKKGRERSFAVTYKTSHQVKKNKVQNSVHSGYILYFKKGHMGIFACAYR